MKTRNVLFTALLSSALFLTACSTDGEDLQGSFGGGKSANFTLSLNPSSPSGARSVTVVDDILIFDMTSKVKTLLPKGTKFRVDIATDSDFTPITSTEGTILYLKQGGTTIGEGGFVITDPMTGYASIELSTPLNFSAAGTTVELIVSTDTVSLLEDDPGLSDPMAVSINYGGKKINGNMLLY